MYGEDDPGEQVNTYYDLAPRIIENSVKEQVLNAEYTGILENTPREVIDVTPEGLDPLKVGAGIVTTGLVIGGAYYGAKKIGQGLNFGYNKLTQHRKSPEQKVKEEQQRNEMIK